jgi:hypothetical protein
MGRLSWGFTGREAEALVSELADARREANAASDEQRSDPRSYEHPREGADWEQSQVQLMRRALEIVHFFTSLWANEKGRF